MDVILFTCYYVIMCISIILVEDHKIVREGTRQLLEQNSDFLILGEASDGAEAIELAKTLAPDLVVMDVRLPNMNGIEATRIITSQFPKIKVLILSAYDDDNYVFPLFEAGASGYLLKNSSGAELVEAIRTVYSGNTVLSPGIGSKIIHKPGMSGIVSQYPGCKLTRRELDVLGLAANGQSNKLIASYLGISVQTVQVHFRNIFGKLNAGNRSEAIMRAIKNGWISLEINGNK